MMAQKPARSILEAAGACAAGLLTDGSSLFGAFPPIAGQWPDKPCRRAPQLQWRARAGISPASLFFPPLSRRKKRDTARYSVSTAKVREDVAGCQWTTQGMAGRLHLNPKVAAASTTTRHSCESRNPVVWTSLLFVLDEATSSLPDKFNRKRGNPGFPLSRE